jgi:hypothetical protein
MSHNWKKFNIYKFYEDATIEFCNDGLWDICESCFLIKEYTEKSNHIYEYYWSINEYKELVLSMIKGEMSCEELIIKNILS